jgi:hypothetical protein
MKALLFILFVCSFSISIYGQQGFDQKAFQLLDTSLIKLKMQRKDLFMNWDAISIDKHRSLLQKRLFEKPMDMGDIVNNHVQLFSNYSSSNADKWFSLMLNDAGGIQFDAAYLSDNITATKLDGILGLGLDTISNLTTAFVIRQYIGPLISAIQNMQKSRFELLKNTFLVSQADSMIMVSKEGESANIYELKAAEIQGQFVSKQFYHQAESPKTIISNGLSLARTYESLIQISKGMHEVYRNSLEPIKIKTKYGMIAIGSYGNDIYQGDYIFILDPGGDDIYIPISGKAQALTKPIQCIIDLGGNDKYLGGDFSLASGFFGAGLLYDVQGDDLYHSHNFSQASGVFGIGYLHDYDGNDTYRAGSNTQAMGSFGIGLFIDDAGNDTYTIDAHGQAFAATQGIGILADRSGNDTYVCASPFQDFLRYDAHYESFAQGAALGYRPIASGGFALLMDLRGNDSYIADIYAQGTGYWYSFGALYDAEGEDKYQAYQYAQGSGVHLAQGLLWDKQGDDIYVSHGVSQGCGHDIASGILVDEAGNDSYQAESLSLGAGNANAISIFLDLIGSDSYIAKNTTNTMGYSDFRRNYGMIGIFADGNGVDIYGSQFKNNSFTLQSTFGVFLDQDILHPSTLPIATTNQASINEPLSQSIDSLFIQASAAPQKYQYNVIPARNALISKGMDAILFLSTKLGTESPRERLALDYLLPKLNETYADTIQSILIDSLESEIYEVKTFALAMCGKLKIKKAIDNMYSYTNDQDWRIRALCAQQLGEIGDSSHIIIDTLVQLLNDTHQSVRARAAYSIGILLPSNVSQIFKSLLQKSEFQLIRNSAIQGIMNSKKLITNNLQILFGNGINTEMKLYLSSAIVHKDSSVTVKDIATLCLNQEIPIKKELYSLIQKEYEIKKDAFWATVIEDIISNEKESKLLAIFKFEKKEKKKKK